MKSLGIAFALLTLIMAASPANANLRLTENEKTWLSEHHDTLELWFDANYPPVECLGEDGRFQGIAADIVALIEKKLGVEFVKNPAPSWPEQLSTLERGGVHAVPAIVQTAERAEHSFFSTPYISIPLVIITQAGRSGASSLEEFDGKRVATVQGYASERHLRDGYGGRFEIVPVPTIREGLRDVAFGVVDALVANVATAAYHIEKEGLPNLHVAGDTGLEDHLSIAVHRQYPLLFSAMQKALDDIAPEQIREIRERWIPLENTVSLTPGERRFMKFALGFILIVLLGLAVVAGMLRNRLSRREKALLTAETEILEQKDRLDLALKGTQAAIWDLYPQAGETVFSEDWFAILGYAPGEVPSSFDGWASLTHPDDMGTSRQSLDAFIRSGGVGIYETQFRMRGRDGQWRWLLCKGRAVSWDEDGIPNRLIGMNVDIHRQKAIENELREAEAVSSALFNQAFNFFALLDLDGRILRINHSALNALRHDQDVLGQCFWEAPWWPDKDASRRIGAAATAIAKGGGVYWSEATHVSKTGEERHIDFACSALKNEGGQCIYMIAEGRDITEHKNMLKIMEKSERRFKSIFEHSPYSIVINDFEDGTFLDVNEAFVKSTGFSREEALGMTSGSLSRLTQDENAEIRKQIREGGVFNLETEAKRADGTMAHVLFSSVQVHYGDKDAIMSMVLDITDKKRAELALTESEKKYRDIFNNAPIGIFRSTVGGYFLDANPKLAKMFGYDSPEHIIREVKDIAREIYPRTGERETFLEALRRNPDGATMEVEFKRRDGSPLYGVMHATLHRDSNGLPPYLDGTIEDITERKDAEEALKASERKFAELFMLSPDSIVLSCFTTGRIIEVNESFLAILGYDREEVLGLTWSQLGLHSDFSQRKQLTELVRRSREFHNVEMQFFRKDGLATTHLVSGRTITISGEPVLMSISRDVTDLHRVQEIMIQSEKMVSLGGIAAGIAHEINNPLGIILQATQNLQLRSRPDFQKNIEVAGDIGLDMERLAQYMRSRKLDEFIDHIQKAAVRASEIIKRMLLFSRKSESRRQICDIRTIINEAVALARSDFDLKKTYDFKQIDLSISFREPLPHILCTETEIEQVILNILRNAAQAMAEASPPIQEPKIDISTSINGDFMRIEVQDNGPGMSKDIQKRIMEPFFTTKRPGVGTGLGLSVSYFIITKGHGGHLSVSSEPGKGTVFTIDLPILESADKYRQSSSRLENGSRHTLVTT